MTLLAVRLTALVVLFLATLACGVVPAVLFRVWSKRKDAKFLDITSAKQKKNKLSANSVLNVFMFFGGGVLLATCFCHLLPEVRSNFDNYFKTHQKSAHEHLHENEDHNETDHEEHDHEHGHEHSHGVPYVELAVCGGFFIIYLLEEVVHTFLGHHDDEEDEQSEKSERPSETTTPSNYSPKSNRLRSNLALDQHAPSPANLLSCKRESTDSLEKGYINYGIDLKNESGPDSPIHGPTHFPIFHSQSIDALVMPGSVTPPKLTMPPVDKPLLPASIRFARGLVTIAAFSAHSVFDGVAIGLQESTSQIWTMFFAICIHKLVVAFAVGMELLEKTSSLTITSIHMTLFSLMSPIGILIVILTETSMKEGDNPVIIMLSAVATGTILYIVFFEILQRDRSKDGSKLTGFVLYLAMIAGFAAMVCITLFIVH